MKTKKTAAKPVAKPRKRTKSSVQEPDTILHSRPSMGDPDREQELPIEDELPDLDNDTVHKTVRPDGPVLEDDDLDDELVLEHQTDRDEDVSEDSPLHVGHYAGR
jgi:hypothetical protein